MPLHVITNFQIFLQEPDREERAKIVKSLKSFVGNGVFSSSGRFNRRFHIYFSFLLALCVLYGLTLQREVNA